jgi:hypothetical protein
MENVKELEEAVAALSAPDLLEFRRWFSRFDAAAWDSQIEIDVAGGKLNALAAEALAEQETPNDRAF